MLALQSAWIDSAELDAKPGRSAQRVLWAPWPDRFSGESDASCGQEFFNIPVAWVDYVAEPDGNADDIGRESVAFVYIDSPI